MWKRLNEFPDRRVWDMTGFTLDQICLDFRVTLLLAQPESSVTVVLESPFSLRFGSRTARIIPEQVLSTVPVLLLLHGGVQSLTAFRDGRLLITFEDNAEIEIEKDGTYESWQTFGDGECAGIGMLAAHHPGSPWGG